MTVGLLAYLLLAPRGTNAGLAAAPASSAPGSAVRLTTAGHIQIQPDSPLFKKLQTTTVRPEQLAVPVLTVTGSVAASLRPVKGKGRLWQFSSAELLTTYTDWQKAIADIAFARNQLDAVRQLAENRVRAQEALVQRLRKLVAAGTDTDKDLAAAQTELLQAQIQSRKDTHEAATALRVAQRAEAALGRQLQQAGVDPELLRVTTAAAGHRPAGRSSPTIDIVVADVPESLVSRVRLGQQCEARFASLAGRRFAAKVRAIAPVLSKERRALRVLFAIDDPDDLLRPGMFADIGLGTDPRAALLGPLAGVVHVGRADYLLVRGSGGDWRVTAVQVGEVHQQSAEILDGLRAGDVVIGQGAILLKPYIVEAVQSPASQAARGS